MKVIQAIKDALAQTTGSKTYLAGAGLLGLAFYQFTAGDPVHGLQSAMAGLAAIGVGHKLERLAEDNQDPPAAG